MKVDRCVCFNKSFKELSQTAQEQGVKTLLELQKHVEFGLKCQLCHPYVETMLHTHETEFYTLLKERPKSGVANQNEKSSLD